MKKEAVPSKSTGPGMMSPRKRMAMGDSGASFGVQSFAAMQGSGSGGSPSMLVKKGSTATGKAPK